MKTSNAILILALCIVVIIFAPFGTIWSLNTLFDTRISYSLEAWFAVVFLSVVYNAKEIRK
jgi:hypothetical protein